VKGSEKRKIGDMEGTIMTEELAKILRELHSTGQTGSFIIFVILLAFVVAAIWVIWLQRQTIQKLNILFEESNLRIKEVEATIKAADAARAESRESQKIEQGLLKDQLDAVLKVNEGFRQDIQCLNQKQDDLRENVRKSIDIGLQEIREKLYEISVKEIVSEIPASFRQELEGELTETSERILCNMMKKFKQAPEQLVDLEAVKIVVERTGRALIERWDAFIRNCDFHLQKFQHIPPQEWEGYARFLGIPLPWYMNEEILDPLARKIANHFFNNLNYQEFQHIPPQEWERYSRSNDIPFPWYLKEEALYLVARRIADHLRHISKFPAGNPQ
jgi:hypothetical protein